MVAQTRKGGVQSPRKLKFSEKLVGKGLTADALLKKLKALHTELAELDQDDADRKTLEPICKELVNTSLLLHKDKGVKAYVACCLADLLRLFAPDAPYVSSELRDIFQFFFRQLTVGLKGSDSPYYTQYFHLLESLSTVKSVVLVCDLPQAEELMNGIFHDFFQLVGQNLAKNIEMFMSDILIALIDECQILPSDVLEIVMAQFMDKNARMDQPAYRLAVEVCNATSDKLQRHVCQYFTDNIVQHAQNDDFDEVARCHELIKQLNHACPALLHNVVPQLEEELRVDEVQLRQMATHVLGEMFADKAGGDLEKKYPSTWALWLTKRNDKSPSVRLAFVEGCKGLLQHHRVELREVVEEALHNKLFDPDEKVRAAVCKLYAQLDYETCIHYVSERQLRSVGERSLDKKQTVRQEALTSLGRIYSVAYPEIENNNSTAIAHFAWIPQQVLHSITATSEVKAAVFQVIADFILPLPTKGDDEVAWTDRLLTVMRHLDEKAKVTLMSISNLKLQHPSPFERFIECCVENNGGVIDEDEENVKRRLATTIRVISGLSPDAQKASEDLKTFANMNEQRLYKLLKTCIDTQTDLKGLVKAMAEFSRRLEGSGPSIIPTMMFLIRQAGLWFVNQSSVPTLVKRLQKGDHHGLGRDNSQVQVAANNAQAILTTMSKCCASVYRPHVSELVKAIADEKNPRLIEVCLQALAAVSRQAPALAPSDKRTLDRLAKYGRGTNARHAKFAARILAHSKDKDVVCSELVKFIADDLPKADSECLVAHVAALIEIVRFAPDAFELKSDVIIAFLLKETLLRPSLPEEAMDTGDDTEWMEDDDLPAHAKAKILALKLCRHRCLVHSDSDSALDIASPVIKMFFSILENGGLITNDSQEDSRIKSRLRLQAAWSLVQLSIVEKFLESITPHFLLLILIIQDPSFNVRLSFLTKLIVLVHARKPHARFNVTFFLTAHDPEDEIRDKARSFVLYKFRNSPQDLKVSHWEMIFIRLLHAVAHHPDFGLDDQHILDVAKYIRLYLNTIATADNVSLLYNIATKCKTVRDAESHTFSENLYALSELALEMIKNHARARQWSLPSYPGKVRLPSEIFRPLPSVDAQRTIMQTTYLPEHVPKLLEDISDKSKAERRTVAKRKAPTSKSNGAPKRPRGRPRKQKLRGSDVDEDEDDEAAGSDGERSAASPAPDSDAVPSGSDDEEEGESGEERKEDLGRGARSRAKAKAKRHTKRKPKQSEPVSDD